jgi:hypothetical protein
MEPDGDQASMTGIEAQNTDRSSVRRFPKFHCLQIGDSGKSRAFQAWVFEASGNLSPDDLRLTGREEILSPPRLHRYDELPPVYSSAGCSPAEPASASTGKGKIINEGYLIKRTPLRNKTVITYKTLSYNKSTSLFSVTSVFPVFITSHPVTPDRLRQ